MYISSSNDCLGGDLNYQIHIKAQEESLYHAVICFGSKALKFYRPGPSKGLKSYSVINDYKYVFTIRMQIYHGDVIKWKRFRRHWPFAMRIHQSSVDSAHKQPLTRAFMFSLILV